MQSNAAQRVVRLPVVAAEPTPPRLSLLDQLLAEQQELTAVERFAQRHADAERPLLEPFYRERLPAAPPGPGQQYAFEVDLDKCSGCKACVTACHSLNGLDEGETWRQVGLLHGGSREAPVQKTVTAACHHCVDPACMKGCPVGAYEKDAVTGIVRHLDDQCIGCQYCVLTCPYEVPQYNPRRGIVRKCDMCAGRLAVGEAPACVQSCPSDAIAIRVVETARVVEDAQADAFLPGAPAPSITVPTTVYKTAEPLPRNLLPADFFSLRPAQQHMPLVIMLVLTQLSAGTLLVERALGTFTDIQALRPFTAALALAVGLLALGASTLHLGRPIFAFRALLGLGTSWISREILAFGLFAGAATGYAAALSPWAPDWLHRLADPLGDAAAGLGVVGIVCSMLLYAVTHRVWWSASRTTLRFFGTAFVLGTAVVHLVAGALVPSVAAQLTPALVLAVVLKLVVEASVLVHLGDKRLGDLRRSATLLITHLREAMFARLLLAGVGVAAASLAPNLAGGVISLLALLAGELIERRSFFSAASAPRMPGVFR